MLKQILILAFVAISTASTTVNPSLSETLASKGTANVFVKMSDGTQNILQEMQTRQFTNRASRLNSVASALKTHATSSQKNVLKFLSNISGLKYKSIWISNQIFIAKADSKLVEELATIEGIGEIYEEHVAHIDEPLDFEVIDPSEIQPKADQPNIELIQAHYTWSLLKNNGTGAIVANVDTGVRYTHEILRDNFYGDYGWYDPNQRTQYPNDTRGHGTHNMGILAGKDGYGVAPGSKWMACRGCMTNDCYQYDLELCAQFILCPTHPDGTSEDCSKAPHVVSNSWVGGQGDEWYNGFISAWKTAGIIPVFAVGNGGSNCETIDSPADSVVGVLGIGSSLQTDEIAYYSGKGPSATGLIKPDMTAPGSYIRSAYHYSDTYITSVSGTSQATPHVAGAIALLVAEGRDLSYEEIVRYLTEYTDRAITQTGKNCGDVPETTFPNNAFGWGRLNVYRSVRALQNSFKTT